MAKTTIELTGYPTGIKVNTDGTAEIIMKNTMSVAVPKGLKTLGSSNYLIQIGPKAWSKIQDKVSKESFLRITGEPKASVTAKGVPFINVVAFVTEVIELQKKEDKNNGPIETSPKEIPVTERTVAEVNTKPQEVPIKSEKIEETGTVEQGNKWYLHPEIQKEFKLIDSSLVILTEPTHLRAKLPPKYISKKDSKKLTVIVRPLAEGKYSLTVGFLNLLIAKLYNIPVYAYVFDGKKEEVQEKYHITF